MSTNKELALQHLSTELDLLHRAAAGSPERALHLGVVLGAVSAYRNLGVLGEDDLLFMATALAGEDDKLPILRGNE